MTLEIKRGDPDLNIPVVEGNKRTSGEILGLEVSQGCLYLCPKLKIYKPRLSKLIDFPNLCFR